MAGLSPSGGRYFETTELAFRSETITAVGFDGPPAWSYTLRPIGETPASSTDGVNIRINVSGYTLTATYVDERNLFPLQKIVYLDPQRQRQTVTGWDDIPDPRYAPDVIELHENHKSWCEWDLSVSATGIDNLTTVTVRGNYTIRVYANYDTSRDRLINELQRR